MNKRFAYLHIGTTKTGSTTIQASLDVNRRFLRELNLVLPPNTIRKGNSDYLLALSHRNVRRDYDNLKHFKFLNIKNQSDKSDLDRKVLDKYAEFINGPKRKDIVFSDEFFFSSNFKDENCIRKVIKFLNQFDLNCKIVVYLRNQSDWILSDYIQNIKGGGIKNLNKYIFEVSRTNSSYDLLGLINNLEEINAELIIRPYKRDVIKNWNILDDFYSLFRNLNPTMISKLKKVEDKNKIRPTKKAIEEIIYFNKNCRNNLKESLKNNIKINSIFKDLVNEISHIYEDDIPLEIKSKNLELITSRFSEGNGILIKRYPQLTGYLKT